MRLDQRTLGVVPLLPRTITDTPTHRTSTHPTPPSSHLPVLERRQRVVELGRHGGVSRVEVGPAEEGAGDGGQRGLQGVEVGQERGLWGVIGLG
jgi:hypothetical protein